MRLAYADPPYIGCAHLYPEKEREVCSRCGQENPSRKGCRDFNCPVEE